MAERSGGMSFLATFFVALFVSVGVYLGMEFWVLPMLTQRPAPKVRMRLEVPSVLSGQIKVPSFRNMNLSRAKVLLRNAGLRLGSVRYAVDEDVSPAWVLRQQPAAGKRVAPGTSVHLVVNKE
ncbi:MAG: PASTA domain-containing protein [Myxococcales bacterium]|nr:PASTA domain-containing protein [Myxococcales bacterium]MCB9642757.1 PASTA domain-containing protein [Myxococcales bacterium]